MPGCPRRQETIAPHQFSHCTSPIHPRSESIITATGCLGGMGTSGLVSTFGPISDGKRMLVGGFMRELVLSMHQRRSLGPHVVPEFLHSQLNRWVPFKPEALKRLLDEMAQDAGVDVRFFTRVGGPCGLGRVTVAPTRANGRPAVAMWRRDDAGELVPHGVLVLEVADEAIVGFDAFIDSSLPALFA